MAGTRYCVRCLTTFAGDPAACPNLGCRAERPAGGWGALLEPGDLIDRHYRVTKVLAVGGAGLTYLAREIDPMGRPTGDDLAIKVLYEQRDSGPFLRRLSNEAQILQELAHDHIVVSRGFVSRTGHPPYLVTRFERGGSLYDHVKRSGPLPPVVAANVLRQILLALDVAHQRGVVHRDLKPQNVLLERVVARGEVPHVRVADFGIAKVQGGLGEGLTAVGGFVGTPEYAAPEQFAGKPPTPATDVFAAGGLLHFLVTGRPPFKFQHRHDIAASYAEMLEQLPPVLPPAGNIADVATLQAVLHAMMHAEPTARATVWDVIARLKDLAGQAPIATDPGGSTVMTSDHGGVRSTATPPTASPTLVMPTQDDPVGTVTPVPPPRSPPQRPRVDPGAGREGPVRLDPRAVAPARGELPKPPPPTPATGAPTPTGSTSAPTAAPLFQLAPPPPPRDDLSLDDLLKPRARYDEPADAPLPDVFEPDAPSVDLGDVPGADRPPTMPPPPPRERAPRPPSLPPMMPAERRATPPTRTAPPAVERVTPVDIPPAWVPDVAASLPTSLPGDAPSLVRVLGEVGAPDRAGVLVALERLPPNALAGAVRAYRPGGMPVMGRGVALAVGGLERADQAAALRGLLGDPDPSVRACAAEAVGAVGTVALLPSLQRLLVDADPEVRVAAIYAIARGCKANGRPDLGRGWLAPLVGDANETVRRAVGLAKAWIDQ